MTLTMCLVRSIRSYFFGYRVASQEETDSQNPFHGPPETHHNSVHLTFKEEVTGKGKINCIVSDLVLT